MLSEDICFDRFSLFNFHVRSMLNTYRLQEAEYSGKCQATIATGVTRPFPCFEMFALLEFLVTGSLLLFHRDNCHHDINLGGLIRGLPRAFHEGARCYRREVLRRWSLLETSKLPPHFFCLCVRTHNQRPTA